MEMNRHTAASTCGQITAWLENTQHMKLSQSATVLKEHTKTWRQRQYAVAQE
jgi:hypothetical protein